MNHFMAVSVTMLLAVFPSAGQEEPRVGQGERQGCGLGSMSGNGLAGPEIRFEGAAQVSGHYPRSHPDTGIGNRSECGRLRVS